MTDADRKLMDRLLARNERWGRRFEDFKAEVTKELAALFGDAVDAKRDIILSAIDSLSVNEMGVIENTQGNIQVLMRMVKGLDDAYAAHFGAGSKFDTVTKRRFSQAARKGIQKALDTVRIGDAASLPRKGWKGTHAMRMVKGARLKTFELLSGRHEMDLSVLRRSFMRHIMDPKATTRGLREELAASGQIKDMLDSAGRRITVDERASRIVSYEFGQLSTQAEEQALADFYFEGEYDPDKAYFLWTQIQRPTKSDEHAPYHNVAMTAGEWERRGIGAPPTRPYCQCRRDFVDPSWFSKEQQKRFEQNTVSEVATGTDGAVDVKPAPKTGRKKAATKPKSEKEWMWKDEDTRYSLQPPTGDIAKVQHSLDSVSKVDIKEYTSTGYRPINEALREQGAVEDIAKKYGVTPDEINRRIESISGALESAGKLDDPVTVWRGVPHEVSSFITTDEDEVRKRVFDFVSGEYEVGAEVTLKGLQSTSFYVEPAQSAALTGNSPGYFFEIRAKSGILIDEISHFDDEREWLMPHGLKYRVVDVIKEASFETGDYQDIIRRTVVQLEEI